MQDIHPLTEFVGLYEKAFVQASIGYSMTMAQTERKPSKTKLKGWGRGRRNWICCLKRLTKIMRPEKIRDDRFAKMPAKYEPEQDELAKRIKALKSELKKKQARFIQPICFWKLCAATTYGIGTFEIPDWNHIPELAVYFKQEKAQL